MILWFNLPTLLKFEEQSECNVKTQGDDTEFAVTYVFRLALLDRNYLVRLFLIMLRINMFQSSGRNASIIPILDQNRSKSINIDNNESINIGNRSKSMARFFVIIDFDRFR